MIKSSIRHPITNVTLFADESANGIIIAKAVFGLKEKCAGIAVKESRNSLLIEYGRMLKEFLDGRLHSLNIIPINLSWGTPFQIAVIEACRSIPWGSVVSYGDLSVMAGYPRASRAAAGVMRHNRFPLIVPCHRVIGAGLTTGGFMGATHGAPIRLKLKLLANEGVSIR
ncbi:MAG TPA: MGMT family protein [Chitinivibrionales bacterium]|nr:MGMT family protein [Chitinivibrionales bacterium]